MNNTRCFVVISVDFVIYFLCKRRTTPYTQKRERRKKKQLQAVHTFEYHIDINLLICKDKRKKNTIYYDNRFSK